MSHTPLPLRYHLTTSDAAVTPDMPCLHPDFTIGDVEIVPADGGQHFRIDSTTLRRASRLLASRPEDASFEGNVERGRAPIVIKVDEEAHIIEVLLSILTSIDYSSRVLNLEADIKMVETVALAAEKYNMPAVLIFLRASLQQSSPLLTVPNALHRYALASRFGWEKIAKEAAWDSLDVVLEFHDMPFMDNRRLLAFRQSRIDAFAKALNDANGSFAAENAGTCPRYSEAHGTSDTSWTVLKQSMLLQMWKRPSGKSVFSDTGAKRAFQKAICSGCDAPRAIYDWAHCLDSKCHIESDDQFQSENSPYIGLIDVLGHW